jgi:tetratricopeptide (TPR) repeat protein
MPEQRSQELYDQAMADLDYERFANAIAKLTAVIDDPSTGTELRELALYERASGHRRSGNYSSAESDYATLLRSPAAAPKMKLSALYDRGTTRIASGNFPGAIADYTTVLASDLLGQAERAKAYVNRSYAYMSIQQPELALSDLQALLAVPNQPVDQVYKALVNLAEIYKALKRNGEAIEVLNRAYEMPRDGLPATPDRNDILLFLADTYLAANDLDGAVPALDTLLAQPGATGFHRARALITRAWVRLQKGNADGARSDARSVLRMRVLPDGYAEMARKLLESAGPDSGK